MNRTLPILLLLTGLAYPALTRAQLAFGGEPHGLRASRLDLPQAPVLELPPVDLAALAAQDAHNEASGWKGPFRFGFEHDTNISMDNAGVWHTLPNGDRLWRVEIRCPEALGIGVIFSEYVVPEGGRVFIYNHPDRVFGGFTAQSNPGHTKLGVRPMAGQTVMVEYQEPAGMVGTGHLTIGTVVHVYRNAPGLDRDFGDSGACNVNTICPEGDNWRPEIRSVACILAGGGYCTGTLLNNCNFDSIPYFLTANHCLAGGDPGTWVFRFNWDSPVCDPTENAPTDQTVSGSTQLAANPGSDMLFLQLNSQPPPEFDVTYSGWDATGTAPDSATCIHHPMGDIKKISHDNQAQNQVNIDVGNGPADCWHVFNWDSGTTEPGSSGSALWNQDHRIVGQLYGGAANCSNNVDDYFGRFDVSYPLLTQWLGECDTLSGLDPGFTEPVIPNNTAVTSIFNVPENLCGIDSIHPGFTLKNNGTVVLGSVTINYGIIGGASGTMPWTGNLLQQQTVNVQLPWIPVTNGPQSLTVGTTAPNGLVDGDPTDDSDTLDFIASTPGDPTILSLSPDNYGTEITWELENEFGTLLYWGGPYPDNDTTTIVREFCLGNGCYVFTINDVFGDGICCTEGDGHYSITSDWNTHVVSDGQYGDGEVREFCLEGVGVAEMENGDDAYLWPNPATGFVNVRFDGEVADDVSWTMIDMTGRAVASGSFPTAQGTRSIQLRSLAEGSYVVHFTIGDRSITKRLLIRR